MKIGIEVKLSTPESFLIVKESLTRIGLYSHKQETLFQTAHILNRKGSYYICHFKELFGLDGKASSISDDDYARRNLIIHLLKEWGLVEVIDVEGCKVAAPKGSVRVITHQDKAKIKLVAKYQLGKDY